MVAKFKKNYVYLSFATLFFMIGIMGTRPLVPMLTGELGESVFVIGIIVSLYPLLPLFLSIYAGGIISKTGSKKPLIISTVAGAISLAIPFLVFNTFGVVLSQIIAGLSYTFFIISAQSYIGRNSYATDRDRNVMRFSMGMAIGSFIGPTIGGILADYTSNIISFLILGFFTLIAVLFIVRIKEYNIKVSKNDTFTLKQIEILKLFRIKNFRRAILISTIILTGKDTFISFFPLLGMEMGLSSSTIGIIISLNALAGILIRWSMPYLLNNFTISQLVTSSIFISGVLFFIMPFFNTVLFISLISFLLGLFLGLGQPLSISVTLISLPKNSMSQGLGLRITVNRLVQVITPLLLGGTAQIFNIVSIFLITGIIFSVGAFKTSIDQRDNQSDENEQIN